MVQPKVGVVMMMEVVEVVVEVVVVEVVGVQFWMRSC